MRARAEIHGYSPLYSSAKALSEGRSDACLETDNEPSSFDQSAQGGHVEGSGEEEVRWATRGRNTIALEPTV